MIPISKQSKPVRVRRAGAANIDPEPASRRVIPRGPCKFYLGQKLPQQKARSLYSCEKFGKYKKQKKSECFGLKVKVLGGKKRTQMLANENLSLICHRNEKSFLATQMDNIVILVEKKKKIFESDERYSKSADILRKPNYSLSFLRQLYPHSPFSTSSFYFLISFDKRV